MKKFIKKVTIIDYGLGNISSICSAFEYLSAKIILTADRDLLEKATHLVLPGVGAFRDGMNALKKHDLIDSIKKYCYQNRPFLGICLGMQMIVDQSEEFGIYAGLGIIRGKNIRIPQTGINGKLHKVPHIGWAPIEESQEGSRWQGTILDGITRGTPFYFVHSYTVATNDDGVRLADTDYNGRLISAVINKGNIYGTQFHPEKSGEAGLHVLQNFLDL